MEEEAIVTMADPRMTIVIVLAVGIGLALLVCATFHASPRITRLATRSLWCPFRRQNVTAEFREEAWDGKLVDVLSCTAFHPPSAVECDKLCLRMEKFPALARH